MKSCYGRIVTWSALRKRFTSERGLFLTTRNFEVEDSDEESICHIQSTTLGTHFLNLGNTLNNNDLNQVADQRFLLNNSLPLVQVIVI